MKCRSHEARRCLKISTHILGWCLFAAGLITPFQHARAQSSAGVWEEISPFSAQAFNTNTVWIQPDVYKSFRLNHALLHPILAAAPKETTRLVAFSDNVIALPMPDGSTAKFRFVESPVMAPELASKFPEIKTYVGQGIDDPRATLRFDVTPAGFHAQILSPSGAVYVDPFYRGDTNTYACYYKRDYSRATNDFQCLAPTIIKKFLAPSSMSAPLLSGSNLRTYRLACAATGEYTQFQGGTVSAGMAAIVTAINRVTGVYETELAIRLVLVANNNLLVYTNAATDPYNNGSPSSLLTQNQSNIDSVIGSANYDIGHVFSTAGGGLAGLGVACVSGNKARGETGTSSPVGDPFYIDYVAHEMGHQFGANHTFNSSTGSCGGGNRNAATAYEVGSGSTIMAYAGICGADDLQPHSDPYFHSVSLDEINTYTTSGAGAGCPVVSATGNGLPTVSAGSNFVIPRGTPFTLTAAGNDPNGDVLTYCWEERDLGPSIPVGAPDNGSSPLFRSFNPALSPSRTFPAYSSVINNALTPGESYPSTSRTMQFRVVARDNKAGGGGVNTSDASVTIVSNAGPFSVTAPGGGVIWSNLQTVTWNVAGTTASPINAASVNILLSTNGGISFPIVLATNRPNNGSQSVILPNLASSQARIRVEAIGNIFFDISRSNFTIIPAAATPAISLDTMNLLSENCVSSNGVIDPGETVTFNVGFKNSGQADSTNLTITLLTTNGVVSPSGPQSYGTLAANGGTASRAFSFTAGGSCGGSVAPTFLMQDASGIQGNASRVLTLGTMTSTNLNVTNSTSIAILDNAAASPYPSAIVLSGVTGTVTKVTATLQGLSHTFPDDIDIVLVGPNGQTVMLMSDTGDGSAVTNLTLTFDDSAGVSLPDSSLIVSGTYKPTNFDTNTDNFPAPAPVGPFGNALSVFNGINPNGTWALYVQDDAPVDVGSIARGWTLSVTVIKPSCCTGIPPSADLAVSETVSPAGTNVGGTLVYTALVTNTGPADSTAVIVTNRLPAALTFLTASSSQGSWSATNGTITFSLGTITNRGSASVSLSAAASGPGIVSNGFGVASAVADPVAGNNNTSVTATVNSFPSISAIPNQTVNANTATPGLGFIVGDAETPASALSVFAGSSNPALCPITNIIFGGSGSSRTVRLSPTTNASGTCLITISVSDGSAVSNTTFQLTVNPLNHAPVLPPIANYAISENALFSFTNAATDLDSPTQQLVYALSNAPSGAVINPASGVFSWTPSEAQGPSTNIMTVSVTDNGFPPLSDYKTFMVIVKEVNSAPILASIPDQTIIEETLLLVTNQVSDLDLPANGLTFRLETNAPAGASINPTNGILNWTPSEAQGPSTNLLTVIVSDDGVPSLSATQSFTVVVLESNRPPVLAVIADVTINAGDLLSFTNSASDPDLPANLLAFSLANNAPSGAALDASSGIFTWRPLGDMALSTNIVSVIVTDDGSPPLSATQSFTVTVLTSNLPPVLLPVPDQVLFRGATLVVTNVVVAPPPLPRPLIFSLDPSAPAGATLNSTNGILLWSTAGVSGPCTNHFVIIVRDAAKPSLVSTQAFSVVVLLPNTPPVLSLLPDRTIHAGTLLVVTNQASDLDVPANLLTFSLEPGSPASAFLNPGNGVLTFPTSDLDAGSTNVIAIRVTDDGLPNMSDKKQFVVTVVARPLLRISSGSNNVNLQWDSIPGQGYRVQYQDSIPGTNWMSLSPDVLASGTSVDQIDSHPVTVQRFYRLMVIP